MAGGNALELANGLPFDRLCKRVRRGFGGSRQRMIVGVGLDTNFAVSGDMPRLAAAPGRSYCSDPVPWL